MMSRLVDFRRLIIYGVCVFVVKGFVMLNVTSSTSKCPGYKISISCVVDPQTTAVQIQMPNKNDASSCTAPLNTSGTYCPDIGQYETVVSTLGTTTTFVLTIRILIKSIHNGIWRCQHGDENSTAALSVIPPLSSKGRVPTITTNSLSGVIVTNVNISGHVYCQNSEITTEILYASQGEQYTVLESEETQWLHAVKGHNGCDPGESNQTYTFPVIWTMSSLTGKKVSFKIRFKQYVCGENFTTNSSGTFIFTGPPMDKAAIINHNSSLLLVPEATSVTMQCVLRGGIPLAVIAWNCLGGNVTNTSVDGIARSNITFLTSKIQNGSFCTCFATHPVAALFNASVQILITYAANITGMVISGDNFTVPEHSTPTITCDAEGSPLPLITLRHVKNNTVIAKTTGLRLQYTLPYARCEDTGKYRCEAVNMVKQSHVMEDVFVLCSPRPVDTDDMYYWSFQRGKPLNISLVYIAYPRPEFKWHFLDTTSFYISEITNGSEHVIINNIFEYQSRIYLHASYMTRSTLRNEDFGRYLITAKNEVNVSTNVFTIVAQGKPNPPSEVTVDCFLSANITWTSQYNNGATQRFYISYINSGKNRMSPEIKDPGLKERATIEIHNLKESSSYTFLVIAVNKYGETKSREVFCTTHSKPAKIHQEGLIIGSYFGGFITALIIFGVIAYICSRARKNKNKNTGDVHDGRNQSRYEDMQMRTTENAYDVPATQAEYEDRTRVESDQTQYETLNQSREDTSTYEKVKPKANIYSKEKGVYANTVIT